MIEPRLKFWSVQVRNARGERCDWFYLATAHDDAPTSHVGRMDTVEEISKETFMAGHADGDWPQSVRHQYTDRAKSEIGGMS